MIERVHIKLLSLIAFSILSFVMLVVGQTEVKAPDAKVVKTLSAEAAADRLMNRFYETLDFGTIWKELAVSNTALRTREVDGTLSGSLYDSKAKLLDTDKERAYVAQGNFNLLFSAVRFTAPEAFSSKEFLGTLKEPFESLTRRATPILSGSDLHERITSKLDHISTILRKQIQSGADKTTAYQAELQKVDENEPEDTERVRATFQGVLANSERLYVARREIHYLYFIKEGGDLRLLTIRSRRRF